MTMSPETTRRLLWAGLVLGAIGLLMNGIDWWRGSLNLAAPKLVDQVGMLLLVGAALLTGISAKTRMSIAIFALVLIVLSTALMVLHAL